MFIQKNHLIKAGVTFSAAAFLLMANEMEASANQYDSANWEPRTVSEIENEIADQKSDQDGDHLKYTLRWGDTLWGISEATDISVDKLVKVNEIANRSLIHVGSTLHLSNDLSILSVQNGDEEVVSYDVSGDEVVETETPAEVEEAAAEEEQPNEEQANEEAVAQAVAEAEAVAQAALEQRAAEEEANAQAAAEEEAAAQAAAEEEAAAQAAAEEEAAAQAAAEEEAAAQAAAEEEAAAQAAAEEEAAAQAAAEEEAAAQAAAEEEAAAQAAAEEEAAAQEPAPEASASSSEGRWMSVEATAYSRNQPVLGNITFSGIDLRENPRVIAVDPDVIPLGSTIYVPGRGEYIAGDTGGAIIGNRIDIHIEDLDQAIQFGRRNIDVQIIE
ncbi:Cell wall-binding protein [Alkalibacterium sp. AK22]|uniref:3D domain-containing protein n=1 Tax=Alkalibacterium sp. AK22 TaxID=1229520 RepID=UPI00044E505E|nr:3D domain-containing protein [Alkalibacterium sp. AK22]EXJ23616.1 Cell wall-binding protein [Alkalibacterium sp. AK22]